MHGIEVGGSNGMEDTVAAEGRRTGSVMAQADEVASHTEVHVFGVIGKLTDDCGCFRFFLPTKAWDWRSRKGKEGWMVFTLLE